MEYYIHYVPGRLRIRTPILHNDPKKAAEFANNLKNLGGIVSIRINPVTGSALLIYDEKKINC